MTIAVVVVGTGIAALIASRVSKPIVAMVGDVRQIASGNLSHRTRLKGGGELALLARTLDRMAESLSEAQEAERELSAREREMEVAREVREALLPQKIPTIPGHALASLHLACPEPEGDFHDYIAVEHGRLGLLVCQVNGKGVPGALVGATARAYLRNELERGGDLSEAFKKVNRELARDVRRGMYITALYADFDPAEKIATVVCAGHKLPLVRYAAAEGKLRTVQPEGIALAFDRGPVFEKNLQIQRVPLEKGDRLFLANTGAVRVLDEEGKELGEKGFYQILLKASRSKAGEVLARVRAEIEAHAGDEPLPADISVLLLAREE
jgi:sigma-B regulation protein RsbU (phosphoserine phosphatase)